MCPSHSPPSRARLLSPTGSGSPLSASSLTDSSPRGRIRGEIRMVINEVITICNINRKLFLIVYHLLEWLMDLDNMLPPTRTAWTAHKTKSLPRSFPLCDVSNTGVTQCLPETTAALCRSVFSVSILKGGQWCFNRNRSFQAKRKHPAHYAIIFLMHVS